MIKSTGFRSVLLSDRSRLVARRFMNQEWIPAVYIPGVNYRFYGIEFFRGGRVSWTNRRIAELNLNDSFRYRQNEWRSSRYK